MDLTAPSQDEVRELVAHALGLPAADIAPDENLFGLGLDSIRLMRLAGGFRRYGVALELTDLAEDATVQAWQALIASTRP